MGAWRAARERQSRSRLAAAKADTERDEVSAALAELERLSPRDGKRKGLAGTRRCWGRREDAFGHQQRPRRPRGRGDRQPCQPGPARPGAAGERARAAGAANAAAPMRLIAFARDAADRALIELSEGQKRPSTRRRRGSISSRAPWTRSRSGCSRFAPWPGSSPFRSPTFRPERRRIAERLRDRDRRSRAGRCDWRRRSGPKRPIGRGGGTPRHARRGGAPAHLCGVEPSWAPETGQGRFRVAVDEPGGEAARAGGVRSRGVRDLHPARGAVRGLGAIASGGELARLALALKARLAGAAERQPVMIFDEVDQGVGGAVADAVGARLQAAVGAAQVLVVTHSPQVAARADATGGWPSGRGR